MRAIFASVATTNPSASATGLTGLDQNVNTFSIAFWCHPLMLRGATTDMNVWRHTDNQGTFRNGIVIAARTRGRLAMIMYDASSPNTNSSADGIVVSRGWAHFGIMHNGATIHYFRNGALVGTFANTFTPTAAGTRVTNLGSTNGLHAGLWDMRVSPGVALSVAEMCALADPRIPMRGCKQRLMYTENFRARGAGAVQITDESGNGNHLTSSAIDTEATIIPPPNWRRILFGSTSVAVKAPLVGAVLEAALTSNTSITAALAVDKPLAAALSSASTITAALTVAKPLASALTSASTITASLTVAKAVAAALSSNSTVTAALAVAKPLAAALASVTTIVATLVVPGGPIVFSRLDQGNTTTVLGSQAFTISTQLNANRFVITTTLQQRPFIITSILDQGNAGTVLEQTITSEAHP